MTLPETETPEAQVERLLRAIQSSKADVQHATEQELYILKSDAVDELLLVARIHQEQFFLRQRNGFLLLICPLAALSLVMISTTLLVSHWIAAIIFLMVLLLIAVSAGLGASLAADASRFHRRYWAAQKAMRHVRDVRALTFLLMEPPNSASQRAAIRLVPLVTPNHMGLLDAKMQSRLQV